ncbi:H-NS histone family protein [Dyella sp.]|uniref:H-NS histone family protein n=1 Tax=Dyella sp. TaxID=1869338 RepID=UPI002ED12DD8
MAIDLHSLSYDQLQDLIERAQAQISSTKKDRLSDARRKIQAILTQYHVTLEELFSRHDERAPTSRPALPAKYRNPSDPLQTWSGVGRKPRWVVEALKQRGVSLEQFLVKAPTAPKKPRRAKRES